MGRRYLPRGWADFGRQLAIWFGFVFAYQVARGLADRHPERAFTNGWRVTEPLAHALWGAGLAEIGVSIDYPTAARHDAHRRICGR